MEAVDTAEILVVAVNLNRQCHTSEDHNLLAVQSNPHTYKFISKICFDKKLPNISGSPKLSCCLRFSNYNFATHFSTPLCGLHIRSILFNLFLLLTLLEDYKLVSSSQFGFPLPFTSSVVRVYVLCMPLLVRQKTA